MEPIAKSVEVSYHGRSQCTMKTIISVAFSSRKQQQQAEAAFKRLTQELAASLPKLLNKERLAYYGQRPRAIVGALRMGISRDSRWKNAIKIAAALRFMKKHLNGKLNAGEVAHSVAMSRSRFSTVFKEQTGESFNDGRIRLRIEQAQLLLHDSERPVQDIARAVGFPTYMQFRGMFKRCTHKTASEYRREFLRA